MGYDLPASIGAAVARPGRRVICLAGDGSLQMNIQELATIRHHRLPVKLFVLDNGGYVSIRTTQNNFFGATIGSGPQDGISFPDFAAVAEAYGLPTVRLDEPAALDETIAQVLAAEGPIVCHVFLDPKQGFEPRIKSRVMPDGTIVSPALDDMFPFLEPSELPGDLPAAAAPIPEVVKP
jgi:acetolactate synthase-1/2/3 large subunit